MHGHCVYICCEREGRACAPQTNSDKAAICFCKQLVYLLLWWNLYVNHGGCVLVCRGRNVFFLVTKLKSFDTSSFSKFLSHAYFLSHPFPPPHQQTNMQCPWLDALPNTNNLCGIWALNFYNKPSAPYPLGLSCSLNSWQI